MPESAGFDRHLVLLNRPPPRFASNVSWAVVGGAKAPAVFLIDTVERDGVIFRTEIPLYGIGFRGIPIVS